MTPRTNKRRGRPWPKGKPYPIVLHARISERQRDVLAELAKALCASPSAALRWLIDRAAHLC